MRDFKTHQWQGTCPLVDALFSRVNTAAAAPRNPGLHPIISPGLPGYALYTSAQVAREGGGYIQRIRGVIREHGGLEQGLWAPGWSH